MTTCDFEKHTVKHSCLLDTTLFMLCRFSPWYPLRHTHEPTHTYECLMCRATEWCDMVRWTDSNQNVCVIFQLWRRHRHSNEFILYGDCDKSKWVSWVCGLPSSASVTCDLNVCLKCDAVKISNVLILNTGEVNERQTCDILMAKRRADTLREIYIIARAFFTDHRISREQSMWWQNVSAFDV